MTPAELMEDIQAETGESSSDAMDLIGHLTSAESCETMEDLEANLLMAKQAAETILSNVKDQIARLKNRTIIVSIYGHSCECRLLKKHPAGTMDVERISDGKCFRVSGL